MPDSELPDPADLVRDALQTLDSARNVRGTPADPMEAQRMQLDAIGRLLAALVIGEATPMTVHHVEGPVEDWTDGIEREGRRYLDAGEPDDGPFGDMR